MKNLILLLLCSLLSTAVAFVPLKHPFLAQSFRSEICIRKTPFAVALASADETSQKSPASTSSEAGKNNNDEQQQQQSGGDLPKEDHTETYRINLKLAKLAEQCANPRYGNKKAAALKAFQTLKNMTYPDTCAFNTVLKCFAKSGPAQWDRRSAGGYAQELLEEMIAVHAQQQRANQEWYQRNAQGLLSDLELSRGPPPVRVKPNVRSFSTIMDLWARGGNVDAALSVLNHLERHYKESGYDVALQPNTIIYNTILSAYAKSRGGPQSAEQAQKLLNDMTVEPDVISYNAVMLAWARSGSPDAGEKAETMLRQMHISPNARSYTSAIDAWSKSQNDVGDGSTAAERAHALLDELKQLYQKTGDDGLRPSIYSWSAAIHAYAMSKDPLKAQKAYNLLQEMRETGEEPTCVTYNTVLNAVATSSPLAYSDQDDSDTCLADILRTLYNDLTKNENNSSKDQDGTKHNNRLSPDHFTFGTVLKACGNNILGDDPTFCIEVFDEACRRGQVSFGVLFQLRQAVPIDVFRQLLPEEACDLVSGHIRMANIPASWKINVHERNPGGPMNNNYNFKSNDSKASSKTQSRMRQSRQFKD